MFKGQFVVFVGIFEVSRLMMLFGSFHEIRVVPSDPGPKLAVPKLR
jgi:hypothetical protein